MNSAGRNSRRRRHMTWQTYISTTTDWRQGRVAAQWRTCAAHAWSPASLGRKTTDVLRLLVGFHAFFSVVEIVLVLAGQWGRPLSPCFDAPTCINYKYSLIRVGVKHWRSSKFSVGWEVSTHIPRLLLFVFSFDFTSFLNPWAKWAEPLLYCTFSTAFRFLK